MLSFLATSFNILAVGLYIVTLVKGRSIPNPATWLIWLIIGSVNLVTYFFVVGGDPVKAFPLFTVVAGISIITGYSFLRGRFAKISLIDISCALLALPILILWQINGDPILANLLLQFVYVISFIPTILGLKRGNLQETLLPWVLITMAYSFMVLEILVDWQNQSWVALVHPVINGVIGNGFVAFHAWKAMDVKDRSSYAMAPFLKD